ncbi:MAG: AraC family transcriptional regulator [Acidobacteriota bacterium]|nr:AraC family transcriptional regulator [Acidobacteriota bacterium]
MRAGHNSITFGEQLKKAEIEGLVLTETFHAPDMVLPRHNHECANVVLTMKGAFRETIGKRPQDCSSSSLLIKPAGETHANRYGATGAHCFIIEVKSSRLKLLSESSRFFDTPDHVRGGILSTLAMKTYREFRDMDSASQLIIVGLVLEMMGYADRRRINQSSSVPPRWLCEAREFIHAHFSQQVSLFTVAAAVEIHPAHLARSFKRYYQYTVGDYVRHLRLEFAKEELRSSKRSLAEISLAAGFYDQSHFSQSFKNDLGVTPGEFRDATRISKTDTKKLRPSKTSQTEIC